MKARIAIFSLFLAGFGPFTCADRDVEEARGKLRAAEAEGAIEALAKVEDDAAEVHLARAVGELLRTKPDEADKALDQAWRRVAEDQAKKPEDRPESHAQMQARVAFTRGVAAAAQEKWDVAQVEFAKVLQIDPEDADARWNLELAWYMANPPCLKRDDDHEPDGARDGAPPWDEQKSKDRVICPADEDWYTLRAKRDELLYVTVDGKIDTTEGDHRELTLELYVEGRAEPLRQAPVVAGKATVGVNGVPADGTWSARLFGPGDAEFKYTIRVDVVPPCPADDQLEDNDTAETAHELADGQQGGLKACPGDGDWFRVSAPAGEERQVTVQFDPQRAMLNATLFDEAGKAPLAKARATKNGMVLDLPKGEGARRALVLVETAGEQENVYQLEVGPPKDEGKDDQQQDEKDEKDDQDKKDDPKQDDQKDQQKDQQAKDDPPKEQPQPDQVDAEKLIEALDKQDENPQLEKALRELRVVPRMEDY